MVPVKPSEATILICEDETLIARDIQRILKSMGFHVTATAGSAEDALSLLDKITPDLILMDIKLEGPVDGIETARRIQKRFDVPVVFLTAHPDQDILDRAKLVNPAGYLLKPFDERELEITIHLAISNHESDKKIKTKEAQYRQLFENIPIGLYHASSDGTFLDVNQSLVSMLGFSSRKDLLNQPMNARYSQPSDQARWLREIKSKGKLQGFETLWKRKDGTSVWLLESVKAYYNPEKQILCYEGAVQDISDQKRTELELKAIKRSLENYIVEMKEYARIASHDLQTPLRQVSGYAQLLERHLQTNSGPEVNEYMTHITEGTENMQMLLQDFMDYTRILTQYPEKEVISMEAMIDDVISRLNSELLLLNATIDYDTLPEISADPEMIQLLMRHLIDNALKYRSDAPPHIYISASNRENTYQFSIQDNGAGIPKAYQHQIFKMFKRLHTKYNNPGTGLGLAICKQIVKKHGGRIWVQSAEERGTSFFFTIQNASGPVQ